MANERYRVLMMGEVLHNDLTEEEYFDTMEDLAQQFYQTGHPSAQQLKTEIYLKD